MEKLKTSYYINFFTICSEMEKKIFYGSIKKKDGVTDHASELSKDTKATSPLCA